MVARKVTTGSQGPDASTVDTGTTPCEIVPDNLDASDNVELSTPTAPLPGNTFFIRSVSCGRFLTLVDDKIVLGHQDGRRSHWICRETNYWLGFENLYSGRYLGHSGNQKSNLRCSAQQHRAWEYFAVRPVGGEAYSLLTTFYENLSTVGVKQVEGAERLVTFNNGSVSDGLAWEFLKV